jgi:hypothetical protein
MRLVEGILLENSASPLRHYLETCGYAVDWSFNGGR